MPLLNGQPLDLHNYTQLLADDEEVFYCELTNEIFDDYEEYCERLMVCGSMVWSCAITGKSGLTYQEAIESEQNALKNIKDFAPELRTPVLLLASLTDRKAFSDMSDDVYNFVKDRYFVKESVQVSFDDDDWSYGQIKRVILPEPEKVLRYCDEHKVEHPIHHRPYPAELYSYEVEELLDDDDEDDESDECQAIRVEVVSADKLRRVKGIYSKEKNKMYLKQFSEQKKGESWKIKSAVMNKYSITTLKFSDIFVGETPVFLTKKATPPPKVITKTTPKSDKLSQQSMKKFLTPVSPNKQNGIKSPDKKIIHKKTLSREAASKVQKKYSASIDRVLENSKKMEELRIKMEELRKKREEKKNEKERLANFAKEWQKKREDLECDDLIELPQPCLVDCRIPNHIFGDFIMILEFFTCFKDILKVKNYFQHGLSYELLERALIDVEIGGPFSDILQLLLTTVFELQDQEDDEVKHKKYSSFYGLVDTENLSTRDAVKLATLAARWSKTYHNTPLNELTLDSVTVTDILRLHLLSSGGRAGDVSAKWRFQERGGYTSTDDPGLEFRINEPHILKHLSTNSVVTLDAADKVKVVNCLMSQILTYATVRDVIDEKIEKVAAGRKEMKLSQIADAKRDRERIKERKEKGVKNDGSDMQENERKKNEYDKWFEELQEAAMAFQLAPLGQDRGHRRYWIFSSLPGLFVEDDERWPGKCLPQPTVLNKSAVAAHDDDTMTYIRNLFEAGRNSTGSDKENDGESTEQSTSPKKKHFGEMNGVSLSQADHKEVAVNQNSGVRCTSKVDNCLVHNPAIERSRWHFYYREEELNELIKALNKRGYRENRLRNTLLSEKTRILKHVEKCPVQKLNRFVPIISEPVVVKANGRRVKGYDDTNLGYPADMPVHNALELYLRSVILDLEAKIHDGGLGSLKVPDRIKWRDAIDNSSYLSLDSGLTWPTKMVKERDLEENKTLKDRLEEQDEPVRSRSTSPCSLNGDSDIPEELIRPESNPDVKDLAMAVLQIARSIQPKYLKKPLPYEEERPVALTAMERWEFGLMQSTSFTQIYLHLSTLENSVQWNKSVLNAKCKICRRGRDDVNMLLCDGCDRGFHLYCLKPKLSCIPQSDWFCPACRPKEQKPASRSRRRFLEDDEIEEEDSENERSNKRGKRMRKASSEGGGKRRRT